MRSYHKLLAFALVLTILIGGLPMIAQEASATVANINATDSGTVERSNNGESWSQCIVGAQTGVYTTFLDCGYSTAPYIDRGYASFSLSGLPAGAHISALTIHLTPTTITGTGLTFALFSDPTGAKTYPYTNWVTQISGSSSSGTLNQAFTLSFNAAGLTYATSKIGTTMVIGLRTTPDYTSSSPGSNAYTIFSQAALSIDVTYTTPPTITSSPSTSAQASHSYSYQATADQSIDSWTLTGPAFLSVSSSGLVTGTPNQLGSFACSLKGHNAGGDAYKNWTLTVTGWRPGFTTSPSTYMILTHSFSYTPGANESVTFTIESKPTWLIWSGGILSGTPTAIGSFAVHIRADSSSGLMSQWQNFTIFVAAWSSTFTSTPSYSGIVGDLYSYTPTTNETANITILTSPGWLSWSGTNLSGVPSSPGAYVVNVESTSANGTLRSYQNFTITVQDRDRWRPLITTSPPTTLLSTEIYSYTPETNESVILTVLILPSWLSLDSGTIEGRPTVGGNFSVSLQFYSIAGTLYQWQNYSIEVIVLPPSLWAPTLTNLPETSIELGSTYFYSPVYNESVILSLDLAPDWISFDGANLTGTPTSIGDYAIRILAVSSSGTLELWTNYTIHVWQDTNSTVDVTPPPETSTSSSSTVPISASAIEFLYILGAIASCIGLLMIGILHGKRRRHP